MHDDFIFKFSTKRNVLIFLTSFCIYIGTRLHNRALIIFGLFFLFTLIAAGIFSVLSFKKLRASRNHYPRCFEENNVTIDLNLKTESSFPHFMVELVDVFPPGSDYYVKRLVPFMFNDKHTFRLQYKGTCSRRRGLYVIGPLKLFVSDPLGVFHNNIIVELYTNLLVYPQAADLGRFNILKDGTLFHTGLETLLKSGKSEEFTGLRDYQRGDSPKLIHWRSSARHQRLLVKEFREDVQTEVTIFLDLFRLSLSGIGDITTIEYIIKAAATVSRTAIEQGHFVQLFCMSDKTEHIPLGGGKAHLITILDRLTFMKPKGEGSFESTFLHHTPLCKTGSTVVLIVSALNFNHENLTSTLQTMMMRQIKVIVILIDDRTFMKVYHEHDEMFANAAPIEETARLLLLDGCAVYIIGRGDNLKEKLCSEKEVLGRVI